MLTELINKEIPVPDLNIPTFDNTTEYVVVKKNGEVKLKSKLVKQIKTRLSEG